MVKADVKHITFEHIIATGDYRFVCITVDGYTRNLRIYKDGRVESYEHGRFVQIPSELAKAIRFILARTHNIPTFEIRNEEDGLPV